MTRKFSLKDNPIFQRLEIPQQRPLDVPISNEEHQSILSSSSEFQEEKFDPQNLTLKPRPSKLDLDKSTERDRLEVAQPLVTDPHSRVNQKSETHESNETTQLDRGTLEDAIPLERSDTYTEQSTSSLRLE